ncbi:MAG: hypothetical protein A3F72_08180 [Bacteroidetes bacterium RIFCSPLOWO2_12_FULL_35_15]|nr:MAG: hypothetical protein A3F72_08180 [Bacteroidetes bacterium RIFCSPLOWO2_12_FULL_35_15]
MKKFFLITLLLFIFLPITIKAQGGDCSNADPFCTGSTYTFPASTNVADGGTLACLTTSPNPAWYYLNIATSGDIVLNISMATPSGSGADVDFICYGPYPTLATACTNQTGACSGPANPLSNNIGCNGNIVDCSYSPVATETCGIQGAIAGEWYMLLLTNFEDDPATITLTQGNSGPGAGSTNCNILCAMTGLTAVPGVCDPTTNTYTVAGVINYSDPPTSGTLTVTDSCNGITQVFNAPFAATTTNYSLAGLLSSGGICSVTAAFSDDPTCIFTTNFTAPASCTVICNIDAITAIPSACDSVTLQYGVSGSIIFFNPPSTGTLTISNSCVGTLVVLNAPFTSPASYSFLGINSNGAVCNIIATFSDFAACTFSQSYTAPASCSPCAVIATNNGPHCVGQTLNLTATTVLGAIYTWTGPNGFASALQNPIINNVTSAMAGNYTVSVNIAVPPCNSSSITSVVINPTPIVTVNSPTTCIDVPTTLTANGATNYTWSTTDTQASITVSGTTATYTVVGTTGACSDTAISNVTASPFPIVNFSADKLSGCNPLSVLFTANTTGNTGATYTWDFGDGTTGIGANLSHIYTSIGCHTVILTVSFSVNCSITDSIPCMIVIFPQPTADFFVSPSEISILSPTAFFTNTSTSASICAWDFGDNTFSSIQNPSHTYPETGSYPVTLYASNSDGCIDSVTYFVLINDILTVYIPNSFTPNGDGMNNVFYVYSHGIDPKDFELMIFDRWGNKIFKTNDLYEGWNGAVNNRGEIIQEDVYVYRVNYRDLKGRKKNLIGHVSIVK